MLFKILIGAIAFVHILFLIVQMFLWQTDFVQNQVVNFQPEEIAAILAHNQGLYNGFLAAGLIWGLFGVPSSQVKPILTFLLILIAIAGIYGSITLHRPTAFLLQSLPAAFALLLLWVPKQKTSIE